jgi:uncharacterized membrane-anchored protein YitT (DUF2179 family)
MPQIWIPKYGKTIVSLRKQGYYSKGKVYSNEREAIAEGKRLAKKDFLVKLMTTEGKYGKSYSLWIKQK